MRYKKIIMLTMLIVSLLAISVVSAAENTTDIAAIESDMPVNEIQSYLNDDVVIGKTDNGTFLDLQNKINAAGDGGIVNLENNYNYDETFSKNGINITNPITINGNGFTINGLNQSRIFYITALNNVILNNITFINGHSDLGGAILFDGDVSGVVIDNCKFLSNDATVNGGAVYAKGIFVNNAITNSVFASNFATKNGGAIYFLKSSENLFENITFSNNKANTADGGAINFHDQLLNTTFNNLEFLNNSAAKCGGAINTDNNVNDNNSYNKSVFINNRANKGGAFHGYGYSNNNSFEYCAFINNSASNHGGAIYYDRNIEKNSLEYCVFINNSANANGGAIYSYRNSNENNYTNIIFINNKATNNGGAIYNRGYSNSEIYKNIIFINNSALSVDGGCINVYANLAGVIFDNVVFINNSAASNGGAINVDDDAKYVIFIDTVFINNTAGKNGGALSFDVSKRNRLENTTFIQNQAALNGSAIRVAKNMQEDVIIGSYFSNNQAGGAVIRATNASRCNFEAKFINNTGDAVILLNYVNGTNISNGVYLDNNVKSTIVINSSDNGIVNSNLLSNKVSEYEIRGSKGLNADYNWFGYNATNYKMQPNINEGVDYVSWLFLNATATSVNLSVSDASKITFLLYNYNSTSGAIFEHFILDFLNVTVSATNGDVDKNIVALGENITFTSNAGGIAKVTGTIGNFQHTINLMINKISTMLTANSVSTTYNVNKNLVITLKDANGNAISNAIVSINLNGAKTSKTDKNGQIIIPVSSLIPKTYTAKITFAGDDKYLGSSKTAQVTVKKATPKITAKAKTFKTTTKTKKYSIVLKNNVNKPIKKATVYLKVSGKTYKATTNSKGKATFKITNLNKKGTYKAAVTYKGNKYYNKATKKVTIKVKSVWKTVSKGSKESAIVKKIQRALKNNGYYLEYNGRYLMVDGIYWDYTEMAVKEFQNDKVLKVTGKVDEKTAKKLGII